LQRPEVELNGIFQAEVKGIAYQRVTDRHFIQPGKARGKKAQVLQAEVVSGIDAQPDFLRNAGALDIVLDGHLLVHGKLARVRLEVDLDEHRHCVFGADNNPWDGVDKYQNANPERVDLRDDILRK